MPTPDFSGSVGLQEVLFEVTEDEFRRSPSVRQAISFLVMVVALGVVAGAMAIWSLTVGQLRISDAPWLVLPFLALALGLFAEHRSYRRLNRFGIYGGGIAPPLKPRLSPVGPRERLIIPFSSIVLLDYRSPDDEPWVLLESREGLRIAINHSMIAGQLGRNPARILEAQRVLEETARRFDPRRHNGAQPGVNATLS